MYVCIYLYLNILIYVYKEIKFYFNYYNNNKYCYYYIKRNYKKYINDKKCNKYSYKYNYRIILIK